MPKTTKWPEAMWQEVLSLRKAGLTHAQVIKRLEEPDSMKRFGVRDVPSEATEVDQTFRDEGIDSCLMPIPLAPNNSIMPGRRHGYPGLPAPYSAPCGSRCSKGVSTRRTIHQTR